MGQEEDELELERLEQEKESLKKNVIKYQQMGNNAKKLSGYPSGDTKRAQGHDKQANIELSQKWKAELDDTLNRIKEVDKIIQLKKKENTENKKEIKEEIMAKLTKRDILRMVENSEPARMTKSELIESISNRLLSEDMNDDVRRKIESGEHDYSEHIDPETVKRMANEIMRDIKANIESKGGRATSEEAQRMTYEGLLGALEKEGRHKRELEQLAIKLVSEEYNVPQDVVDFEAKITGHPQMGGTEIRKQGLKIKKGSKRPPQGKTAEELKPNVTKRRLMNAMMHGAARKGQNLFHMASEELNKIDPTLIRDYGKLMAGNDFSYWALDDETIKREGESGTHAGQVRVYPHGKPAKEGNKPKIEAEGMTFPLLLHELTKGVMELISQWGREADKGIRDYVEDQTDNLESETMDIRLGVKIWEKLLEAMDIDALPYKAQIFTTLSALSPNEFNSIINGLLNNSEQAKEKVRDIVYEVIRENNEEEVEQAMSQFREPEGPNPDDDEGPVAPEGPEDEDDELARLLGNRKEEPIDNPRTWSKSELEKARDEALDDAIETGDFSIVALYQSILDEKS